MTVTCPEGHQSEATDYCDTCGAPIAAASAAAPAAGDDGGLPGSVLELDPAEQVATVTCPHCGGVNVADALFCEACGYDFTTGTPPLDDEPAPAADVPVADDAETEAPVVEEAEADEDAREGDGSDVAAAQDARPDETKGSEEPETSEGSEEPETSKGSAEPEAPEPVPADSLASAEVNQAPDATEPGDDSEPQPAEQEAPAPAVSVPPPARDATPMHARPRHTPPSRALADVWVVEVWVDPDWYAVQQTEEACPSAGVPDIVVVRRNVVLVGRPSGSLGVRPDVDAGADSAVSRRHAQLTSDGRRWWIEDLGSSNGTYVGEVGEPLPTAPLTPGVRVEIDRDDRIYVGAWTRLVIRQATASEQAGQG